MTVDPNLVVPIAGMVTGMVALVAIAFTVVGVGRGPIGQAISRRLAGRSGQVDPELSHEVEALRQQLEHLEQRLMDSEERLDFAERLLARKDQPAGLPASSERA